ncbi:BQ5605_C003g01917 [Microbotryum silenes-dioicae]|uniref:BQ5605_C003g01917 protein n=1 Tax=Microbotryum silenes-dioicae TaxID=796604 RepID=A0A2X0MM57_9BASI|nr:BQ5605_C003g01917 [Microbotryum silenes-dioicae]
MQYRSRGKSSTARFGGVTVAMAGDPKQCLPVTLNGSVRWSDRRVGRKSEATPSRYSTARFGGVTVALAGNPKQCLPVILNGAVRWSVEGSEAMPSRYSTAYFGGVTIPLAGMCPSFKSKTQGSMTNDRLDCNITGNPKQCLPVVPRLGSVESLPVIPKSSPAQIIDACLMEC